MSEAHKILFELLVSHSGNKYVAQFENIWQGLDDRSEFILCRSWPFQDREEMITAVAFAKLLPRKVCRRRQKKIEGGVDRLRMDIY